jgi:hypothetical protein
MKKNENIFYYAENQRNKKRLFWLKMAQFVLLALKPDFTSPISYMTD